MLTIDLNFPYDWYGGWQLIWILHTIDFRGRPHNTACAASPTLFLFLSILGTNPRLESPIPPYFSCTTFRNSATTPATPSIPNATTLPWTLWCSDYSVAKGQQFSCPRRTAIPSLMFEHVVPKGWIIFFPFYIEVIIYCCTSRYDDDYDFFFFVFSGSWNKHTVRNDHVFICM